VWYAIRASGLVAYLLLTASTVWGIMLTSKVVKEWVPAAVALDLHNYLSWTAVGITVLHAVLLLVTSFYDYSVLNLLIPFTGPYDPFWVGLGIISLYLMVLTSITFYMIKRIGMKTFRLIHYLTYVGFVLGLLHSLMSGTDDAVLTPIYMGSRVLVLFLTLYRILAVRAAKRTVHA
jgi:predicted ferric reductase